MAQQCNHHAVNHPTLTVVTTVALPTTTGSTATCTVGDFTGSSSCGHHESGSGAAAVPMVTDPPKSQQEPHHGTRTMIRSSEGDDVGAGSTKRDHDERAARTMVTTTTTTTTGRPRKRMRRVGGVCMANKLPFTRHHHHDPSGSGKPSKENDNHDNHDDDDDATTTIPTAAASPLAADDMNKIRNPSDVVEPSHAMDVTNQDDDSDEINRKSRHGGDGDTLEMSPPVPRVTKATIPAGPAASSADSTTSSSNTGNSGLLVKVVSTKHDEKWNTMFERLVEYKEKHDGSTNVPQCYDDCPKLGRWVHYQRGTCVWWSWVRRRNMEATVTMLWGNRITHRVFFRSFA